jgi:pimeloyl-ACP methyl ester carboxylesterase
LLGNCQEELLTLEHREPVATLSPGLHVERCRIARRDGKPVRAFLTGPSGQWRNQPAVIYCHAHGNRYAIGASELIDGRPAILDPPYAQALAGQGIVALCIDLPGFGERTQEQESALAKQHLWQGRTLFGVMLAELAAALDVLENIDGIAASRIGVLGFSMGATLAFWLGALDPRLKAVVQLLSFADLATLVDRGGHDLHGHYMTVPGLLDVFRTGEIAGLIAPRPQLVCAGLQDPLTPQSACDIAMADVRCAYATAGADDALRLHVERDQGHRESAAMRTEVLRFLGAFL